MYENMCSFKIASCEQFRFRMRRANNARQCPTYECMPFVANMLPSILLIGTGRSTALFGRHVDVWNKFMRQFLPFVLVIYLLWMPLRKVILFVTKLEQRYLNMGWEFSSIFFTNTNIAYIYLIIGKSLFVNWNE